METKQTKVVAGVFALAVLHLFSLSAKSQDEPRIPISSVPFKITSPGSYYFTGDLTHTIPDQNAIEVDVNNVTIDLMGFNLIGPGSGTGRGIDLGLRSNVEIRNGTVSGFGGAGIFSGDFFDEQTFDYFYGNGHRVIDVRVVANHGGGIVLHGANHRVRGCLVLRNGDYGIYLGDVGKAICNIVNENAWDGLEAGYGCTVLENTVHGNAANGIILWSACTASNNTAAGNFDCGIWVATGCNVTGNTTAFNNRGICVGADFSSGNLIKSNVAEENFECNIYIAGQSNSVEENLVTRSEQGIFFSQGGNFYANNRASQNTSNYVNTTGQIDGGGNAEF